MYGWKWYLSFCFFIKMYLLLLILFTFKEEESIEILKVLGLIDNMEEYQKINNHDKKIITQEFWLQKVGEIRNYLPRETNQNKLTSKKQRKVCKVLNFIDKLLDVIFTITGRISFSTFNSLDRILIGIITS